MGKKLRRKISVCLVTKEPLKELINTGLDFLSEIKNYDLTKDIDLIKDYLECLKGLVFELRHNPDLNITIIKNAKQYMEVIKKNIMNKKIKKENKKNNPTNQKRNSSHKRSIASKSEKYNNILNEIDWIKFVKEQKETERKPWFDNHSKVPFDLDISC